MNASPVHQNMSHPKTIVLQVGVLPQISQICCLPLKNATIISGLCTVLVPLVH